MKQYVDTSERSQDVFYLLLNKQKIPLNVTSWGLAQVEDGEWNYRGAVLITSRVFDESLSRCEGKEVKAAMNDAWKLFLEKGGFDENTVSPEKFKRFYAANRKLKKRFLKRRLRNPCYTDIMDEMGVESNAVMCPWVYHQVIEGEPLGWRYDGRAQTLEGEGERAHDYAKKLYRQFWVDRIRSKSKNRPKKFYLNPLRKLEGSYSFEYWAPEEDLIVQNKVIVSPEIFKLHEILSLDRKKRNVSNYVNNPPRIKSNHF